MNYIRKSTIAALGLWTGLAGFTGDGVRAADEKPVRGADIKWGEYMTSAMLVGAIAAAMSRVEHCSKKPLLIEEWRRSDARRDLVFTCAGTEDEEGSSILILEKIGDAHWVPTGFSFAG